MQHPDEIESILFDEKAIDTKISELAKRLEDEYVNKDLLLVGILRGGFIFLADLVRKLNLDCMVDFMCLSSYASDKSTGVVNVLMDLHTPIEGKDVLIVEDIVDTGLTTHYVRESLSEQRPRSLEVCALLDKPDSRKVPLHPKYVGFVVPNAFVVGYGLDYDGYYRNLPYVGILKVKA